jgi:hypothetical protein
MMDKGFNPEMLSSLMDQKDPTKMVKTFLRLGNP